jgi:hypothetical protein
VEIEVLQQPPPDRFARAAFEQHIVGKHHRGFARLPLPSRSRSGSALR